MSYEIKFKGKSDREVLIYTLNYIGMKRYKMLVKFTRHPKQQFKAIRFAFGMVGVQWYPVNVFIKRYQPRCSKSFYAKKDEIKHTTTEDLSPLGLHVLQTEKF